MDDRMQVIAEHHGQNFTLYNADCVEVLAHLPSESIGFSIYSPPFSQLFVYSGSIRDMGNVADDAEFFRFYSHVVSDLFRVTKPGRLTAVHCSDIPRKKSLHGYIGLYDFPADIRKAHEDAGWIYHSRITVWKDPVIEMQRTKALGLLYKQIQKDATRCRQGMPDYVLVFRRPPASEDDAEPVAQNSNLFPVDLWQKWASPVWMDIDQTDVLNVRAARDNKDEKHLCPLQLDLIERCIRLWSNPGDIVLSPFAGIGSEGYVALRAGRRFLGVELKESYFRQAIKYLGGAEAAVSSGTLFDRITEAT